LIKRENRLVLEGSVLVAGDCRNGVRLRIEHRLVVGMSYRENLTLLGVELGPRVLDIF